MSLIDDIKLRKVHIKKVFLKGHQEIRLGEIKLIEDNIKSSVEELNKWHTFKNDYEHICKFCGKSDYDDLMQNENLLEYAHYDCLIKEVLGEVAEK